MLPQHQLNQIPRRNISDFQTKLQGWEICAGQALLAFYGFQFWILGFGDSNGVIIDKLFPFSLGTARQDKYFKPHCRHVTPYDDMVSEHNRKQEMAGKEGIKRTGKGMIYGNYGHKKVTYLPTLQPNEARY